MDGRALIGATHTRCLSEATKAVAARAVVVPEAVAVTLAAAVYEACGAQW